jgi:hypothetical protein
MTKKPLTYLLTDKLTGLLDSLAPSPSVSNDAIEQMSTIANDDPEVPVIERAPKSIPVVQVTKRRREKRGIRQVNSPGIFSASVNLIRTNT